MPLATLDRPRPAETRPAWQDLPAATLVNGLLRERPGWVRLAPVEAEALLPGVAGVISLPLGGAEVLIGLGSTTESGRQRVTGPILLRTQGGGVVATDLDGLVDALLDDAGLTKGVDAATRDRFRGRVRASAASQRAALAARGPDLERSLDGPADFLAAEQGLLLGHAFHPAPKCREGMSEADQRRYGPDHGQGFALHWFAVAPRQLAVGELAPGQAALHVQQLLDGQAAPAVPEGWSLLPAHPWQARHLLTLPAVQALLVAGCLRDLGPCGQPFFATASFRCVYAPGAAHMLKFSLSCKITNSVRVMLPRELDRGLQLARLLAGPPGAMLRRAHPGFQVLNETAHLSLRGLDGAILAESSVVFRDNPFTTGREQAEMLAFLCQDDPAGGRSRLGRIVATLAARTRRAEADVAFEWFERFLGSVLAPLLALQGRHGILMSAHQQNLVLQLRDGWPGCAYFRDTQGTGYRDDALGPLAQACPGYGVGTENAIPADRVPGLFGYYVIGNTVLGVLDTLVLDGLADEGALRARLRAFLEGQLGQADDRVVRHLLDAERLSLKGNLLTYLHDRDENASDGPPVAKYVDIPNPIAAPPALHRTLSADGAIARLLVPADGPPRLTKLGAAPRGTLLHLVTRAFDACPGADALHLAPAAAATLAAAGLDAALLHAPGVITRAGFYQHPHWFHGPRAEGFPALMETLPDGRTHPRRPPAPTGLFYERHDPVIDATLAFRAINKVQDLDLFHGWMNQARVAFYWDLAHSREALAQYLATLEADPHAFGAIGTLDGVNSTYFEVYWGPEDRLGAHYAADPYDRGWHALVGERRHLGRDRTLAWFRAINHALFLDDCRTRRVVGEPRADHAKMLALAGDAGFRKEKEFDFPHKRAALMVCERTDFFRTIRL